jgi:hypothetical protein
MAVYEFVGAAELLQELVAAGFALHSEHSGNPLSDPAA